jgi:flavin-dependent dehydrogenase
MLFDDFRSVHTRLSYARQLLETRYGVTVRNPRSVGGVGHFTPKASYTVGGVAQVGEAAGLQDFLWGFGIRSALRSGVQAAECLMTGRDWNAEASRRFTPALQASVVNRFLFEMLRHGGYAPLMTIFRCGGPLRLLRTIWRFNSAHRFLLPAARAYTRRRYPQLHI